MLYLPIGMRSNTTTFLIFRTFRLEPFRCSLHIKYIFRFVWNSWLPIFMVWGKFSFSYILKFVYLNNISRYTCICIWSHIFVEFLISRLKMTQVIWCTINNKVYTSSLYDTQWVIHRTIKQYTSILIFFFLIFVKSTNVRQE
jgi:hypothetical protein